MSNSKRNRSRSRSPIRSASSRPAPVNMLDVSALEQLTAKREHRRIRMDNSSSTQSSRGRDKGSWQDRMGGRNFNGGGRGFGGRKNFGENRDGNRSRIRDRLAFAPQEGRRRDDDDERKNGTFREEEKPVQKLVDPTAVPRSRFFFTHDDRGGDDNKWRGRNAYDPRIDFGPRRDRRGDRFGNRRDFRDRDRDRNQQRDRDRTNRGPQRESSKADGKWTHDLFDGGDDVNEKNADDQGDAEDHVVNTDDHLKNDTEE